MNEKFALAKFCRQCDRRSFLKAFGMLGLGAVVGGVLQSVFNVVRIGHGLVKVERSLVRMGTYVTLTVVDESRARAEEAIGRAFEEIDRLIAVFSRHDSSTPVSLLNRDGILRNPPPELFELMRASVDFTRLSGGAFDISVKPVLDLLENTVGAGGDAPTREDIDAALARVGSDRIEIGPAQLHLAGTGMGVTLDGIAKGYIVDRASDVLIQSGVDNHLVNAGGDIRVRGSRTRRRLWTIAVEDPKKGEHYPEVIRLTDGAVATSGSYEIYFDDEKVFHHLIDPKTGRSPAHSVSVSVVARTAMKADALSSAVFVLAPAGGLQLVDGLSNTECFMLDKAGDKSYSRGWHRFSAAEQTGTAGRTRGGIAARG